MRCFWPVRFSPAQEKRPAILVFPGANSRDTHFYTHNIREVQQMSTGKAIKVGILDGPAGGCDFFCIRTSPLLSCRCLRADDLKHTLWALDGPEGEEEIVWVLFRKTSDTEFACW